jgi:hypothetical protein
MNILASGQYLRQELDNVSSPKGVVAMSARRADLEEGVIAGIACLD